MPPRDPRSESWLPEAPEARSPSEGFLRFAPEARLGGSLEVEWDLGGARVAPETISLSLVGHEWALPPDADAPETCVFFRRAVFESDAGGGPVAEGREGRVSFELPGFTAHSFASRHNRVVWEIELSARIGGRAVLLDRRPLVVLPHDPAQLKPAAD